MSTYEFLNLVTLTIGTFIAGAVAIGGIITQRKIARQKNTLDFHEKYINQEYDQDFNVIANIYRDKEKIPLADYAERNGGPEKKALMNVLNTWEHFAMGVENGIYEEKMIRDSFQTHVINLRDKLLSYILQLRKERSPTVYTGLDLLATRWKSLTPPQSRFSIHKAGFWNNRIVSIQFVCLCILIAAVLGFFAGLWFIGDQKPHKRASECILEQLKDIKSDSSLIVLQQSCQELYGSL